MKHLIFYPAMYDISSWFIPQQHFFVFFLSLVSSFNFFHCHINCGECESEAISHSVVSDPLRPHQAPLSIEFSRQEYWSVLPFSSPGEFPGPVFEPRSPALQADFLQSEPPGKPWECEMEPYCDFDLHFHNDL